jgi:hypothetical protein
VNEVCIQRVCKRELYNITDLYETKFSMNYDNESTKSDKKESRRN